MAPQAPLWQDFAMARPPKGRRTEARQRVLYRGKALGRSDLQKIRRVLRRMRGHNLGEVSQSVCRAFGWYRPNGELHHSSAKALLRRLEKRGLIQLPQVSRPATCCRRRHCEAASGEVRREPAEWPELPEQGGGEGRENLVVRPVLGEERLAWQGHMARYHYLGCGRLVGESIRYVAVLAGRVVGLVAWAGAVLKCGVRDRFVGWDEPTKAAKLGFVVNNVRFLVLPWVERKNLASRILAANLRRLSSDWQVAYGHPVYLAETFVDGARFRGTCYRASNWLELGETRGWARCGGTYRHHGERKLVFVYLLSPRAVEILRAPETKEPEVRRFSMIDVEKLPLRGQGSLVEEFEAVPDLRKAKGKRFQLWSILSVAACATVSGARSFEAMAQWASELPREILLRLGCRRRKPPSERTYRRAVNAIGAERFEQTVNRWSARQTALRREGISIDGKTVRGSADGEAPAAHLLSACTHQEGVVLAQQRVSEKTNEIPCVKPLLKDLDIEGSVVTADAMHTQKDTARFIVEEKKADYLFTVKDNQPSLRDDIALLHLEAFSPSGHLGGQGARSDRDSPALGE